MKTTLRIFRRALFALGSLQFSLAIMLGIFVLVLTGTLLQPSLGIYGVQQKIFSSWLGGNTLLLLFIINLLASLGTSLLNIRRPLGLILGHLGIIVLLLGGFTGVFSSYYLLGIREGDRADAVFSQDRWELVISIPDLSGGEYRELARLPLDRFSAGDVHELEAPGRRLRLDLGTFLRNARPETAGPDAAGPGVQESGETSAVSPMLDSAGPGNFRELPWEDSASANLPALVLELSGDFMEPQRIGLWAGAPEGFSLPGLPGSTGSTGSTGSGRQSPSEPAATGPAGELWFRLEPARLPLPFVLQLDSFEADFFPGTDVPRSFESRVTLLDGAELQRSIRMNEPLRYRGFVFYQNSYQLFPDGRDASIFSVQRTRASYLPYAGFFLSIGGFLLHYLSRKKPRPAPRKAGGGAMAALILAALLLAPGPGLQADDQSPAVPAGDSQRPSELTLMDAAGMLRPLAVFASGRVMPMESFGESLLYEISGRRKIGGLDGLDFMGLLLFDISGLADREIIRIDHPDLPRVLGIVDRGPDHYSLVEINPALGRLALMVRSMEQEPQDPLGRELEQLYARLEKLFLVAGSFHRLDGPASVSPEGGLNLLPGEDGDRWQAFGPGMPPPQSGHELEFWWEQVNLVLEEGNVPELGRLFDRLAAYQQEAAGPRMRQVAGERIYRRLAPWSTTAWLFMAGGLLLLVFRRLPKAGEWPRMAAIALLVAGQILLTLGLVLRVLISGRPPVTNLYTTLLTAAWLILPLGYLLQKKHGSLIPHALLASGLLFLSPGFLPGSDDLAVVQAVLDSSFWLTIHVLVIIAGYVMVLISSLQGHWAVIHWIRFPEGGRGSGAMHRNLVHSVRLALALVFLGTMLGGFWADHSWGRFWGWDPKENAALLLILWLAMLLHVRPAGIVREFGLSLLAASGVLVLLFSWFGVNLMATGLHSYGWNSSSGLLLLGAGLLETLFILWALSKRPRDAHAPGLVSMRILDIRSLGAEYLELELYPPVKSLPGQYMSLVIASEGERFVRAYSLTHPKRASFLIQRQESGLAWDFFSKHARPGMRIMASSPQGEGWETARAERMLMAVSASGIAPVLSYLRSGKTRTATIEIHWLVQPDRDALLVEEVKAAVRQLGEGVDIELRLHAGQAAIQGSSRLDLSTLDRPTTETVLILCGGEAFVHGLETQLEAWSRPPAALYSQAFSPAPQRSDRPDTIRKMLVSTSAIPVTIRPGQSVLQALQEAGHPVKGSCLVGQCGECRCRLLAGSVQMDEPNLLHRSRVDGGESRGDSILTCCSYPLGDIQLEI